MTTPLAIGFDRDAILDRMLIGDCKCISDEMSFKNLSACWLDMEGECLSS
jgi:hypothetical protein